MDSATYIILHQCHDKFSRYTRRTLPLEDINIDYFDAAHYY